MSRPWENRKTIRSDGALSRRRFIQIVGSGAGWIVAGRLSANRAGFIEAQIDRGSTPLKTDLIEHQHDPLNAEPTLLDLTESWITPLEHFYVRNHGSIPTIDSASYRLSVGGLVDRPLSLSISQLKDRFQKATLTATMTCAGNRRSEFTKKTEGVQWNAAAIGNAQWEGVRLSDVLKLAGIQSGARHVWFEGLDDVKHGDDTITFGGSIPLEKALGQSETPSDPLIAWGMNQRPLTAEHGFPLRAVVPGYIGARSVKWLGRIKVSDRPSDNHYLAHAYKLVTEGSDAEWLHAKPIYEFLLNSAGITLKRIDGSNRRQARLRGYALPAGIPGRTIAKVELSTDGGQTWSPADLSPPAKPYCWQLWTADVPVNEKTKSIIVRAADSSGDIQPRQTAWNLKGYLYNGWHSPQL